MWQPFFMSAIADPNPAPSLAAHFLLVSTIKVVSNHLGLTLSAYLNSRPLTAIFDY